MPLYYISDHAYNKLINLAQLHGFVNLTAKYRHHGMSEFIDNLAHPDTVFVDGRSLNIKNQHKYEIARFHAPTWTTYHTRRTRALQLKDETIIRLLEVALQFQIISKDPYLKAGPSRFSDTPTISLVLEGIGNEWIIPENIQRKRT